MQCSGCLLQRFRVARWTGRNFLEVNFKSVRTCDFGESWGTLGVQRARQREEEEACAEFLLGVVAGAADAADVQQQSQSVPLRHRGKLISDPSASQNPLFISILFPKGHLKSFEQFWSRQQCRATKIWATLVLDRTSDFTKVEEDQLQTSNESSNSSWQTKLSGCGRQLSLITLGKRKLTNLHFGVSGM